MIQVQVNYYHKLRDLAATPSQRLYVDEGSVVRDVLTKIACSNAGISSMLGSILIARNNEYAKPDEPLQEGDVLDLMPPVSGG